MQILVVDDDKDSRKSVKNFLEKIGHSVSEAENGLSALKAMTDGDFSIVLSDIKMPKMDGIELLQSISGLSLQHQPSVVLFTGYGDMESAIAALRAGAYDYLTKPLNVEELAIIVQRVAEYQKLQRGYKELTEHFEQKVNESTARTKAEMARLREMVADALGIKRIGIFSESMMKVYNYALKYHTDRSIPILIQGETGTGKEIVARIIHYGNPNNPDVTAPFVDVNCATFSNNLFESELFGYEPGAYTGSLAKGQKGKMDLAFGGTLFLDEIGEFPLELQSKILRAIQEQSYFRVGGLKKIKADVRLICATNVDLAERVNQGLFRRDLYYRLKVGYIRIPPLRERKEEILPLANMFLKDYAKVKSKKFKYIGEEAAKVLLEHKWPGNVRELKNVIEWVTFMHNGEELKPEHLEILTRDYPRTETQEEQNVLDPNYFVLPKQKFSLENYINRIIHEALKMHKGNKTATARYLDISRRSLYSRLKHIYNDK